MAARVRTVDVPESDRRELERRGRGKRGPGREVERARIVLLAAEGVPGKQIAARVGCAEPTVVTWRGRYAERGLVGLEDLPRPGRPSPLPEGLRDRVLELTLTEPPTRFGATHWSTRLLATALAEEGTGRFHHHPGHPQAGHPVAQRQQRGGHRGDGADLLHPLATRNGDPHAADHLGLAD